MSPATGNGGKFRYGYYEARMHFDPTKGATSAWFPCFWSLSDYHTRYNNPDRWAELDFFEAYTGGYAAYSKAYFGTVHDWANSSTVHYQDSNNYQPSTQSADFNQWHTYGCLWTPGSITWYFDRVPLMTQTYSATAPPNPLANGTITPTPAGVFSILDTDPWGITLILGSSPEWPMYVNYVQVWQQ
jgi:beta-glucanase (GH16 family)